MSDWPLAAREGEETRLQLLLSGLEIFSLSSEEMKDIHREQVVRQLQQAALLGAVYGRNQLRERLTEFWLNHFNVYALKSDSAWRLAGYARIPVSAHLLANAGAALKPRCQATYNHSNLRF